MCESLEGCLENEYFTSNDCCVRSSVTLGEIAFVWHECPECGRMYQYVYEYQGIWDSEEGQFVHDVNVDFDADDWEFDGVNITVSGPYERYKHSWIVDVMIDEDNTEHDL